MPEPDKDAETDVPAPKPEKKSNVGMILVIFALAGAAGAAYYYIKFVKGRKPKDEDMDFFDDEGYEEETYINEDLSLIHISNAFLITEDDIIVCDPEAEYFPLVQKLGCLLYTSRCV